MAAVALCLVLQLLTCSRASEPETFSNGWRPIPRERVFWNMVEPGVLHATNADALIQEIDAPKAEVMSVEAGNYIARGVSFVLPINRRHFNSVSNMKTEINDVPYRRGKKLDFVPSNVSNKAKKDDAGINENNKELKPYEVEEHTEELVAEENVIGENNYDDYDKKPNNLTDNLLKILNNYNIRTDDRLPNYALSIKKEGGKSNGGYIRMPYRYNSLNHVPVDPLLAVFLSNYGHYIPGLFGFQHDYKNLYGYTASNSIHNNKPFGAYKIFADNNSAL